MWDPEQYNIFADYRARPALDLIARIPNLEFNSIIDLGCGTGDITQLLWDTFATAKMVVGLDSSEEMLNKAIANYSRIRWELNDIQKFYGLYDLVFSNASLQWVSNHTQLITRLIAHTNQVLALQMPNNFAAPSHVLLQETIDEKSSWQEQLAHIVKKQPVLAKEDYLNLLYDKMPYVDLWETQYIHQLEGENPVLEWVRGTALRPIAKILSSAEFTSFTASYGAKLAIAYPKRADGTTLFPFNRVFMVAAR